MSLKYPKCAYAQVDLLAGKDQFPIGCVLKDGKILRAFNAVDTFRTPITNLMSLRCSRFASGGLAYTSDEKVYRTSYLDATVFTEIKSLSAYDPFFIEQKTGDDTDLVLFMDSDYVCLRNGGYFSSPLSAELRCGVLRCGRVFGFDSYNGQLLKWSGEGSYKDWEPGISGAGQAYLDCLGGEVWSVFDFEDELVALQDNGIIRISVAGNPENFRIIDNFSMPTLFRNTAAVVGKGIYFCAEGGLYCYRGGKVNKIGGLISEDAQYPDVALCHLGKYYVVGATSATLSRRAVYMYDTVENTFQIVNADAYYLAADNRSLLGYAANAIYRIQPTGKYSFGCGKFDFGSSSRKLLTSLEADCDEDVEVSISNGRFTRTVAAGGKTRLNMRGVNFSVTVKGSGEVRSLKLNAEVRK